MALDVPLRVIPLIKTFNDAGAGTQATVLADRIASQMPLTRAHDIVRALQKLQEVGGWRQITVLLGRNPAAEVSLNDSRTVATLVTLLREIGAPEQADMLASRRNPQEAEPPHLTGLQEATTPPALVRLKDQHAMALLIEELHKSGRMEDLAVVGGNAASDTPLDKPHDVARLLTALDDAGALPQARLLSDRVATHADITDPWAVAALLRALKKAGATEPIGELLKRDPAAHVAFPNAEAADQLRKAFDADTQTRLLLKRATAEGMFNLVRGQAMY